MLEERLRTAADVLARRRAELDTARADAERHARRADEAARRMADVDEAIEVVRALSTTLQDSVRLKVQAVAQAALDATFPGSVFTMEFVPRRDRMDVDMFVCDRNGNKQSILFGSGGGLKDMVSFALRVAVWSLDKAAARVILLDEPMKFVSSGMRRRGAELLRVLSRDLGAQFVVVSHVPEIIDAGTSVYRVSLENGVSVARAVS